MCDDSIQGCSADVLDAIVKGKMAADRDAAASGGQVEVEDELRTPLGMYQETPKQQAAKPTPETVKKANTSSESRKTGGKTTEEASSIADVIKGRLMNMARNVKSNFYRVKMQSKDLVSELYPMVAGRNWAKLGARLKERTFYQKYWYAFLWYGIVLYLSVNMLTSLMAKPTVPVTRGRRASPTTAAGSAVKRTGARTASAHGTPSKRD